MTSSSGTNVFQDIAKKADILKVVSYYIPVTKQGSKYKACCPFHNDHHPSMDVNIVRNDFKCWSCGEGGDAITFVEKYEKVSKIEALKKVCQICQIPLPESLNNYHPKVDVLKQDYPKELDARNILSEFYSLALSSNEGKAALDYLTKERKIPKDVIEHFHIGYAPLDQKQAINVLKKKGVDALTREKAGILSADSIDKDRYSQRIRFPILDNDGHIVAFSGRMFLPNQSGGKYINSPETVLFKKSSLRYHFYEAKEDAKKSGYIYLVEGYRDAIAFVRAGIMQVAALMGVALSKEHIQELAKLKCEVRLCLDSDEPGQVGEERAIPLLFENKIPFRILRKFKGAKDADELLTKFGPEELKAQSKRLYDPFLFLLGRQLHGRRTREDSQEITSFLQANAKYYQALNDVSKAKAIEALSRVTSLKEEVLVRILNNQTTSIPKGEDTPNKTYSPNHRYNPWHKKAVLQPFDRDRNRADNYKQADAFEIVFQRACLYPVMEKIDSDLLKNETQIIRRLPLSREATAKLQDSRVNFSFSPFFDLANRIGNLYRDDSKQVRFDADKFKTLNEQIASASNSGSEQEEDGDDFGFDDDLSTFSLSKEEQEFLLFTLKYRERLSPELYSPKRFDEAIAVHGLLEEKSKLLKRVQLEKGGIRDSEDKQELIRINLKIKSPGTKI